MRRTVRKSQAKGRDRYAYRGYLIYCNLTGDWFVTKDNTYICCKFSAAECERAVDDLLAEVTP